MTSIGKSILVWAVVTSFLLTAAHGCTVHFKAKDVELDSHSNMTYQLDSVDLFYVSVAD